MNLMKTFLFLTTVLFSNQSVAEASSLRNSRSLALQLIAGFEASTDVSDVVRTESMLENGVLVAQMSRDRKSKMATIFLSLLLYAYSK